MIDPTQAAGAGQQPGASAQPIAVVCVAAMPDGTFMVYPDNDEGEDDSADAAGGDSGAGDDDSSEMAAGQPAKDIKGALHLVQQMLSSAATAGALNPGAAAGAPAGSDSGNADFLQGFKQARGG